MRRIFYVRKRPTAMERARRASRLFVPLLYLLLVCVGHISPTGAALAKYADTEEDTGIVSQVNKRSLVSRKALWKDGIIPYTLRIEGSLDNEQVYRQNMMTAMSWWENSTCIRFVNYADQNYTDQPYPADFVLKPGQLRCTARIGRDPYPTTFYESCLGSVGMIAHELGHVIGFLHEHLRHDRGTYIQINMDNINRIWKGDYEEVDASYSYVNTIYDPGSIMHYPPYNNDTINRSMPAFTIHKHVRYSGEIGQRKCLSQTDIEATNRMYNCPRTAVPTNLSSVCPKENLTVDAVDSAAPTNLSSACSGECLTVDAVYSGDSVGLKCKNGSFNRWMECNGEMCRATGCPGNEFAEYHLEHNRCLNAMFTIAVLNSDEDTPVRVGDSIALAVKDPSNEDRLLPLHCSLTGNCFLNMNTSCHSRTWYHQNSSECQHQTFKVAVPGKDKGDFLKRNNTLILQDSSHTKLSLGCDYSALRRRQRKCYLQRCTSDKGCARKRQRFIVFKLSP